MDELRKHEDCWLFIDPVTEAIAPGYHDVIKHPMDIVTVEKKLKNEEYPNKVISMLACCCANSVTLNARNNS